MALRSIVSGITGEPQSRPLEKDQSSVTMMPTAPLDLAHSSQRSISARATVLLLVFGSKLYPAEPTIVEKFVPSVEPSSDRVSVRGPQLDSGGSLRTTLLML